MENIIALVSTNKSDLEAAIKVVADKNTDINFSQPVKHPTKELWIIPTDDRFINDFTAEDLDNFGITDLKSFD